MSQIYDYYDDRAVFGELRVEEDKQWKGHLKYNNMADCYEFWADGECIFPRLTCGHHMQVLINGIWQHTTLQKIGCIWYLAGTLCWGYLEDVLICL